MTLVIKSTGGSGVFVIGAQSPQRKEAGMVGWVNKTLDFNTGDNYYIPVSYNNQCQFQLSFPNLNQENNYLCCLRGRVQPFNLEDLLVLE